MSLLLDLGLKSFTGVSVEVANSRADTDHSFQNSADGVGRCCQWLPVFAGADTGVWTGIDESSVSNSFPTKLLQVELVPLLLGPK